MDITTNDVIKFDKIIKLPIKEQKQEINDNRNRNYRKNFI